MMVFLLALMSLLGNIGTLLLRHCFGNRRGTTTSDVTEMFVSHLSVCNCMMGVYLAILSVADQLQGVDYLWTERAMRSSSWCVVSCVLFLLPSEVSVFIVTITTLERCWVVSGPHVNMKTRKLSVLLCIGSWISGFVLASVPAAWTSLISSGACIPSLVPVPGQQRVHHYAVGVLVVLNAVLMSTTLVGQGCIYATAFRNEVTLVVERERVRYLILALRVMTIAVTDACAWFLVALLTLLISQGVLLSTDVSFTSILLAMVTKPCINPYLYLYRVVQERRRQTRQQQLTQWLMKNGSGNKHPT